MKLIVTFITLFFIASTLNYAQIDILGKIKEKVEEKIDQKTDEAIDEGLDKIEDDIKNKDKNKENQEETTEQKSENETVQDEPKKKEESLSVYRKFDFIPGQKILFYDDFSTDNIGDFPAKWNTSGTGEIVTISKYPGNWFKLVGGTSYVPEIAGPFPENFTVEFDLLIESDKDMEHAGWLGNIIIQLYGMETESKEYLNHPYGHGIEDAKGQLVVSIPMDFGQAANFDVTNYKNGEAFGLNAGSSMKVFMGKIKKIIHFSMLVNKARFRMWVDETKVLDLPKAMPPAAYNVFHLGTWSWGEDDNDYGIYLNNFKLATGVPDTRKTFETEKKFVTQGILFDVNSDKIKSESYGVLKSIADVLKEHASSKFLIVGHTDSDGDDKANLELSKKRAASVKDALVKEFGVDGSKLETDGKGEKEPVADNKTTEGKASNRRVEFIKK